MKFQIIKVSADGEQISAEVHLDKGMLDLHRSGKVHLREQMAPIFDLVDARLLEMNKRIMASNYMVQKLEPAARDAINNVMDVLTGRSSGPAVEKVLEASKAEMEAQRARLEQEQAKVEAGVVQGATRRKPGRPRKEPTQPLNVDAVLRAISQGPVEAE